MARDFAEAFYKSAAWQKCRAAYIRKVAWLCEDCLEQGVQVTGVIVHHKIPLTPENINDPAVTLNFDNLRYVCRDCHAAKHAAPKRYRFDADGHVILPPY